ncbi:MAG: SpoIIE family protein phosphatase [Nitrospirae bacterium]|nr:SpoIIE family protein phosphatase [Nitrospirota bacterium]MBF0591137.1 SpoIIE family protein phosphatase [Nitrospirota bacterium]
MMKKKIVVVLFIFWCMTGVCFSADEDRDKDAGKKYVLVLNSYSKGYDWTDSEESGIEAVLTPKKGVVLMVEYMDTKRIHTEEHFRLFKEMLANKLRETKIKIDIVICTDDDALNFMKRYRDEILPNTPVVFCGINDFDRAKMEGFKLYTGVNEKTDLPANVDFILKIHPKTTQIYLISDLGTTGKLHRKEFDKMVLLPRFKDRVKFFYYDDIAMSELKDILSKLSSESVVIYLSFFKDKRGKLFTPSEAIPEITEASTVPAYGVVDYMLGYGIVGGFMISGFEQGATAGRLALGVLNSKDPSVMPDVVMESPRITAFDYRVLQRFNIDVASLPKGAVIKYEPETFYYKYKRIVWSFIAVVLIMTMYIIVLMVNIKRRIRAEKGLQNILKACASFFEFKSTDDFVLRIKALLGSLVNISGRVLFFKNTHDDSGDVFKDMVFIESDANMKVRPMAEVKDSIDMKVTDMLKDTIAQKKNTYIKDAGILYFANKNIPANTIFIEGKKRFDNLDKSILEMFTSNLGLTFDNFEKQKLEESLNFAGQIQMNMLSKDSEGFAKTYGIDLHAFLAPAKVVGGDFYDYFSIDDTHICLVMADVADKGMPAALFMAVAKTLIRAIGAGNPNVTDILYKVNNELNKDNEDAMFVTLFMAILNYKTGELSFSNAGHNPPYLLSNGQIRQIGAKDVGIVLGIMKDALYSVETIQLSKGDGVFMYTDGIVEAMNITHELFGEHRLEKRLASGVTLPAKMLADMVLNDVIKFAEGAPQSDDITVMSMFYKT